MVPSSVGIGLRQPHAAALAAQRPLLGFLEVHSENYFAAGGAARASLAGLRQDYPVSLHGVGLSLGSASGLDPWHLQQLQALVAWCEPVRVSDHASFARVQPAPGAPVWHGCDLLPIGFTSASLALMVRNVQQVQECLRRPLLVENLSAYLAWSDDTLAEPQFFNELVQRSGCQVLLDVNNLVVNALNDAQAPVHSEAAQAEAVRVACAWIDALAPQSVTEIHLAGYSLGSAGLSPDTEAGAEAWVAIDDHGSRVHAPVWQVYQHAVRHCGAVPTLIEWDTDLPDVSVLVEEAHRAQVYQQQALQQRPVIHVREGGLA